MVNVLNKASDGINRFCKGLVVVCTMALVLIMFIQVLRRFLFGEAITWADGTARYLLIWSTFLGASIAAKESGHISLTFVQDKLKGNAKMIFECVMMLFFAVLTCFIVYAGIKVLAFVIPQKSDSLPISVAWVYSMIPFGGAVMTLHLAVNFINKIIAIRRGEVEEGGGTQ